MDITLNYLDGHSSRASVKDAPKFPRLVMTKGDRPGDLPRFFVQREFDIADGPGVQYDEVDPEETYAK